MLDFSCGEFLEWKRRFCGEGFEKLLFTKITKNFWIFFKNWILFNENIRNILFKILGNFPNKNNSFTFWWFWKNSIFVKKIREEIRRFSICLDANLFRIFFDKFVFCFFLIYVIYNIFLNNIFLNNTNFFCWTEKHNFDKRFFWIVKNLINKSKNKNIKNKKWFSLYYLHFYQ